MFKRTVSLFSYVLVLTLIISLLPITPFGAAVVNAATAYTATPRYNAAASSALSGWSASNAIDSSISSAYSSVNHSVNTATEWISFDMGQYYNISRVRLNPRFLNGVALGFPVDFKFQFSNDSTTWYDVPGQSYSNYAKPVNSELVFNFASTVFARYIRLYATKLGADDFNTYYLQLSEFNADYAGSGTAPNVVPSLQEWTSGNNTTFNISAAARICIDPAYGSQLTDTANTFKDDLQQLTGRSFSVVNTSSPSAGDFYLTLNCTDTGIGNEGYLLNIDTYATTAANSAKGVFYGTRTILQMLNQSSDKTYMLKGSTRDYPKYGERSFMLDVARKYFSVDFIKDYIKFMSYYKMNDLHIHFSDNQAFRLVSDTYPGLAASQSYTKAELRSIQDLAKKYNVTIMPEIDLPGHALAITNYLPSVKDTMLADVLNLASSETTTFVHNLLDEFIPVFDAPDFHIGTDEVSGNLDSNPTLHNYAVSLGFTNANDLYRKFINDTNNYIKSKGKRTRIWAWYDRIPGTVAISNDIIYDAWLAENINSVSSNGANIINSSCSWLYSVPGTTWQPDLAFLYQSWQPYQFRSLDGGDIYGELSPSDTHLLGIQYNNWNDISESLGIPETQIDKMEEQPIRVISEVGWGGQRSSSYGTFAGRTALAGAAPGLTLIGNTALNNDLAINRASTASSEISGCSASKAVDGASTTRWASAEGVDPQWIYVDLGSNLSINRVKLNWEAAYARAYKIQVSSDAVNWTDVYSTTAGDGGIDEVSFSTVKARYVRMYGTQRATGWGYSLWDFEVYWDRPAGNLAYNRSVTASSSYSTILDAAFSVDNNPLTRWGSVEGADPQWIYVDLGQSTNINRVQINWEAASAKSYKVQVSTDAVNWTDVYSTASGAGGVEEICFPTAVSRYVRIYCTQRNTSFGYSIWNLGVYYDTGNLAQGKAVSASSYTNSTLIPAYAVDGDMSTRWASAEGVDPQWIYVNLGQSYNINKIILKWQIAYGKTYKIQVSNDAVNWTDVYYEANGNGGTDVVTFPVKAAQYVRMYGIQRGTVWGYSLHELEVYSPSVQ